MRTILSTRIEPLLCLLGAACWSGSLPLVSCDVGETAALTTVPRRLQGDGGVPPEGYHSSVFSFEFHLFSNSAQDGQVNVVNSEVKKFLDEKITARTPAYVGALQSTLLRDSCNSADPDKSAEYSHCSHYLTEITFWLDPNIDKEKAERVALQEVRSYVDQFNEVQAGTLHVIYEYPIFVKSSIILNLVGAPRRMSANEQVQFLKNFRVGFEPIMLAGAYEYGDTSIVVQNVGVNDRRRQLLHQQQQQQQRPSLRSLQNNNNSSSNNNNPDLEESSGSSSSATADYNKVKLFVRGTCSGPATCFDENFGRFLTREMRTFSVQFLTLLKTIGPEEDLQYFDQILRIDTRSEEAQIEPIAAVNDYQIKQTGGEEDIPAWLWILLALIVLILGCATGWVLFRLKARRARTAQYDVEKSSNGIGVYQDDDDDDDDPSPERASSNNGNNKKVGLSPSEDEYSDLEFEEQDVVAQLEQQ